MESGRRQIRTLPVTRLVCSSANWRTSLRHIVCVTGIFNVAVRITRMICGAMQRSSCIPLRMLMGVSVHVIVLMAAPMVVVCM